MDNLASDIANYLINQYVNDAYTFCSLSKTCKFFNILCTKNKEQKLLEFSKPVINPGITKRYSERKYTALPGNVPHGLFTTVYGDKIIERTWYDQGKMVGSYTKWDTEGNVLIHIELPSNSKVVGITNS